MKKLLAILMSCCMIFTLAACGQNNNASSTADPAEGFPSKNITFIVPAKAGGGQDVAARIIAQQLEKKLNIQVPVENVPEGSGLTGLLQVANGASDGYTIITCTCVGYLGTCQQQEDLKFNPLTDMIGLVSQGTVPMIIAAGPSSPVKTVDDLISYGQAHPGEMSIAVSGVVNIASMAAKSALNALGVDMKLVPLDGASEAVATCLGGHTEFCIAPASTLSSHVEEGTLIPLFDTGDLESNALNVPNIGDLGHPEAAVPYYRVIACRAGTPASVVDKLRTILAEVLNDPDCQKAFEDAKDPLFGVITDKEELDKLLASNYEAYGKLIKELTAGQ